MKISDQIKNLLEDNNCEFEMFKHEPVRTSEDAAKTRLGITLHQGAKALICEAKFSNGEKKPIMIVLPADMKANFKSVRKLIGAKDLYLIPPQDVLKLTGIEVGGVPPFGNLLGLEVYVDKGLFENEKIAFNAGDRTISVIMKSEDFERLVKPTIGEFAK